MPKYFAQETRPYSEQIVARTSLPAIELFTNGPKHELYTYFKDHYTGHSLKDNYLPPIVRSRGGIEVEYTRSLLSAATVSGSHLIHVRETDLANHSPELSDEQRYFVATADFGTNDITEWWIIPKVKQSSNLPRNESLNISLQLLPPQLAAASQPIEVQSDGTPLGDIKAQRTLEHMQRMAEAQAITLELTTDSARLWWGNFRVPETFVAFDSIDSELWVLQRTFAIGAVSADAVVNQQTANSSIRAVAQ